MNEQLSRESKTRFKKSKSVAISVFTKWLFWSEKPLVCLQYYFFFCLLLLLFASQYYRQTRGYFMKQIYYRALTDLIFPCLSCHCKPRLPSQFGFNNGCAWVFLELSVLPYFGDCLDRWLNPNENWFDNSTGCRPDKRLLSRYEKRQ